MVRTTFATLLALALTATSILAETATVCIAPVPEGNDRPVSLANPAGGGRTFNFEVAIGEERVKVLHDRAVAISALDTEAEHLVRIFRDGKPFASFRFRFERYETKDLCLWFKALYETWSLSGDDRNRSLGCNCQAEGGGAP